MELHFPPTGNADEWQVYLWNLPEQLLSRPQKLELMLMLEAGFNAFNPYQVVADLLSHRDLWTGAVMERGYPFTEPSRPNWAILHGDLIHLRDIGDGHWNVDTLYLHTVAGSDAQWQGIAAAWHADEVNFYDGQQAESLLGASGTNDGRKILRVWWD